MSARGLWKTMDGGLLILHRESDRFYLVDTVLRGGVVTEGMVLETVLPKASTLLVVRRVLGEGWWDKFRLEVDETENLRAWVRSKIITYQVAFGSGSSTFLDNVGIANYKGRPVATMSDQELYQVIGELL